MEPNYQKRLCQQCERRGITLSETQLQRLLQYLELLLRWRLHLNLTGLRDAERIIDVLIGESLDFFQGDFLVPGMRVLDLGTGAGVPGIPLAICSVGLRFTLLDRSEKKITFLHRVVSMLRLENCQPCCGTAEDLARSLTPTQRFDTVVSRGVGHIAHLIRLAALGRRSQTPHLCWRIEHRPLEAKWLNHLRASQAIETCTGHAFDHTAEENIVQIAVDHLPD